MHHVFNDPNCQKLYEISKVVELPEFVKEAAAADEQDFSTLPSEAFAHPGRRLYPLNTKSNTWLSSMHYQLDKEAYDVRTRAVVEKALDAACALWGIEEQPMEKQAAAKAPEYSIALTVDGATVHEVAIDNPEMFKEAAEYLTNNKTRLTYDLRRQFARGLARSPIQAPLDEAVSEYIEKAAGFGMSPREHVGQVALGRVCLINRKYPEYSSRLVEYAQSLPEEMSIDVLHKTASLLDLVDRACGLTGYYGKGIETPEESLFYVTEKTAAEVVHEMVLLTNGKTVSRHSLEMNKEAVDNFFKGYFGEVPYDNVQDMVDNIGALPRPEANAFCDMTRLAK